MADMEFSKSVPEVPERGVQRSSMPRYERSVVAQTNPIQDMQGAASSYAAATNWGTFIGASLAQKASEAYAIRLGTEMGKDPQGEPKFLLDMPVTKFDKAMLNAYNVQAKNTLSIQAQKLIADTSVAIADAPRITPDLLSNANAEMAAGLQSIVKNAPNDIKGALAAQLESQQIANNEQLQKRMIQEQKRDAEDLAKQSVSMYMENAYSSAVNGNDGVAAGALENIRQTLDSEVEQGRMSRVERDKRIKDAEISTQSGSLVRKLEEAASKKRKEQFLSELADGKIIPKDDPNYPTLVSGVLQYNNQQNALRAEEKNLLVSKLNTAVLESPYSPQIPALLDELKDKLSASEYEQTHFNYLKELGRVDSATSQIQAAISDWTNPTAFASISPDAANKAFQQQVTTYVQNSQREGNPVTPEAASVQVAASAGGPIPVFQRQIANSLASSSPDKIETAARQVAQLAEIGRLNAANLSDDSQAMIIRYDSLRDSMPREKAAELAHREIYNRTPEEVKAATEKWGMYISMKKPQGQTTGEFALKMAAPSVRLDQLQDPMMTGQEMATQFRTFFTMMHGNESDAIKMLQASFEKNYGETNISGRKEIAKHPIEKVLGIAPDQIGAVQQDIITQLDGAFENSKKLYNEKSVNELWVVEKRPDPLKGGPRVTEKKAADGSSVYMADYSDVVHSQGSMRGAPIYVERHTRDGGVEKYQVIVKTKPWAVLTGNIREPVQGGWDVALQSDSGIFSLPVMAPYTGIMSYTPNIENIMRIYMKQNGVTTGGN